MSYPPAVNSVNPAPLLNLTMGIVVHLSVTLTFKILLLFLTSLRLSFTVVKIRKFWRRNKLSFKSAAVSFFPTFTSISLMMTLSLVLVFPSTLIDSR